MMLQFRLICVLALLAGQLEAQTPPPPPPPPPPMMFIEEEDDEVFQRNLEWLNSAVVTIDELLNPFAFYEPSDDIYAETPDSVRAANRLAKCYFRAETEKGYENPPVLYYTWYDESGKVQQTSAAVTATGDSLVHRWKYNAKGSLSIYCALEFEINEKGKWNISGDSVLFKYDASNHLIEESRFAVIRDNGVKSDYLVAKTTYKYDVSGRMTSKSSSGFTHEYTYDAKGRPIMIKQIAANKYSARTDSLAWIEGDIADTIDHWSIVGDPQMRVNVDMLIVNRTTGNELRYLLFLPDKYNFIRKVTGPLDVRMTYDAGSRLINKSIYSPTDTLLFELAFSYDSKGVLTSSSSAGIYDYEKYGPAPPIATGHDNLYMTTNFNYKSNSEGELPTSVSIEDVLFDLMPDSRYRIADRQFEGVIKIVQERR